MCKPLHTILVKESSTSTKPTLAKRTADSEYFFLLILRPSGEESLKLTETQEPSSLDLLTTYHPELLAPLLESCCSPKEIDLI